MKKLFGYFLIALPLLVLYLFIAYALGLGITTILFLISAGFACFIRLCIDFGENLIYTDE